MNCTKWGIMLFLVVIFTGLVFARFVLAPEDTWTCVDNVWVKHGHPKNGPPATGCGVSAPVPSPTVSVVTPTHDSSPSAAVKTALSRKYKRSETDFIIATTTDTGTFAKGTVGFAAEQGGAVWLAAKTEKGWELVADGQGPMSCAQAELYHMPANLVPMCISAGGNIVSRK